MGIPHLASHLRPFAQRRILNDESVVIDGPAFAYHILHICNAKAMPNSPLDQPSYALLGDAALTWLNFLQSQGVTVSAIHFDGFLPTSKLPVRLERTVRGTEEINAYYASHRSGVPPWRAQMSSPAEVDLFPGPASSSRGKFPAPPFLVPAIIEALVQSDRYGPITRVVPGEADVFCAHDVYLRGGTILTSDSDLLLYNLGRTGSVVFFRDMELRVHGGSSTLVALKYVPTDIGSRLWLPAEDGLLRLAFESTLDGFLTFEQLLKKSRATHHAREQTGEYERFVKGYDNTSAWVHELSLLEQFARLSKVDTRVAELIVQREEATVLLGVSDMADDTFRPVPRDELTMFLPLLLDHPTRSSAWGASAHIRRLAYGALQMLDGQKPLSVLERGRLQSTSGGSRLELPPLPELAGDYSGFCELMAGIRNCLSHCDLQWIVLSICQDISVSLEQGKPRPLSLAVLQQMATAKIDSTAWDFLHFAAQIHGTYYSCRMLQQILKFLSVRVEGKLPGPMRELDACLAQLPPVSGFPKLSDLACLYARLKEDGGLSCLLNICGPSSEVAVQLTSIIEIPEKKEPPAKKTKAPPGGGKGVSKTAGNPFDVLGALGA